MHHHRRSCVPSPAPEKDSKHFMKAILPPPMHVKEISIPVEFISKFGNELNNVAMITVPDVRQWEMGLKKHGNKVLFCNNWQKFVEYYSICYGSYVDFKYEGNSKFNVVIYDTTSVEISYSFKTERTNDAAHELNPKNPSFRSKSSSGNYFYVASDFAAEYLKPNVPFKLQNSQGKQWEVSCVLDAAGKSAMRISTGFRRFARENNISEGAIYEFELIKRKPVVVLQVTSTTSSCMARWGRCAQSMAEKEVTESKHFKKAILPSPIHSKQIRLPDEFMTRYRKELKNVATVTVPDGRDWKMRLKKCGNDVFFCNKWQEFAEYYSIGYGCYLSFKYEGNSKFSVIIFDVTSVEICYPLKTPSTNGETNTQSYSPTKRPRVETSGNQGKKLKSMSKHAFKSAEDAANEFNPKNPYFCSKITMRNHVNVTSKFAPKYLKPNIPIILQNSQGQQWEVYCIFYNPKSLSMRITKGFPEFQRENNLTHGDYCVFELIKKKPVVLKVTMFVDYEN